MTLSAAIEDAKGLAHWLTEKINGLEIANSERRHLASAAYSVALDHHVGLIVLLEQAHYPSFVALLRCQVDAYVRGVWLASCATDEEVNEFATGKRLFLPHEMFQRVNEVMESNVIANVKAGSWKILCDFAHTGPRQLQRNMSAGAIELNYDEAELLEGLEAANAWALVTASGLADLASDQALGAQFLEFALERARPPTPPDAAADARWPV
jgi:hypothetical protein